MQNQSYSSFWQRIHQSAKTNGFPLRVMFELTYRCNFRCRHCYVPYSYRKKEELKTKEVFLVLEQLAKIGCFYLGFTGGEPFMRKDLIDILWHAKRKGFEIIIYSNGSLIDEKMADELSALKPNKVDITIPAMSKGVLEKITQLPGSQKKIFSAIDLLHNRKVNLGFKTCVLKENASQIKEIQDFAASLDALHRLDDMLSPRLDGSNEPYKYRGILEGTPRATRHAPHADCDLDDTGLKQVAKNQLPINQLPITKDLFRCGVGVSQAAITPLGELKMCLMIDYPKYKILESSLNDSWDKLKGLVRNITPDKDYKCNVCELEDYCKWCPARGWLEDKNFTTCDYESRYRFEAIKESL